MDERSEKGTTGSMSGAGPTGRGWLWLFGALLLLAVILLMVWVAPRPEREIKTSRIRRAIPPVEVQEKGHREDARPEAPPKRPLVTPPYLPKAPAPLALPEPVTPSPGRLFVDAVPKGATVMVLNIVPKYERGMALAPGRYHLQVSSPGYERQRRWVTVNPGGETRASFELKRIIPLIPRGTLEVRSDPPGAQWFLDGRLAGVTPEVREAVETGTYTVKLVLEGYADWEMSVTVSSDTTAVVDAEMSKLGPRAGEQWRDPVTGMVFVWVSDGCFSMGSPPGEAGRDPDEGPVHEVCLEGYWMGQQEVTNAQYRRFRPAHDSRAFGEYSLNGEDQPVVHVSWEDAVAFARWLTERNEGAFQFDLPTEAQWEYACRAGVQTSRFWGDSPDDACRYANVYDERSRAANRFEWQYHGCDDGFVATAPTGSLASNAFGLYDMLGNVWEWCADGYETYAEGDQAETLQATGPAGFRVNRGGGWNDVPRSVRCAVRERLDPAFGNFCVGFRLVRRP